MTEDETAPPPPADSDIPRRLSVLAGLAALLLAAVRVLRGQETLARMSGELSHPAQAAMLHIVWHSLSAIFFALGVLMIISAWGSRGSARMAATAATVIFGIVAVFMGAIAAAELGNALAFYPVFFLAAVSALSGLAAVKA